MAEQDRQALAREQGAVTSDEERDAVLWQNEMLRERYKDSFQRLRRCCICLQGECADRGVCRAEFAAWTERKWNQAVDAQLGTKRKGIDFSAGVAT